MERQGALGMPRWEGVGATHWRVTIPYEPQASRRSYVCKVRMNQTQGVAIACSTELYITSRLLRRMMRDATRTRRNARKLEMHND